MINEPSRQVKTRSLDICEDGDIFGKLLGSVESVFIYRRYGALGYKLLVLVFESPTEYEVYRCKSDQQTPNNSPTYIPETSDEMSNHHGLVESETEKE
jgi:hypothetical protein